MATSCPYILGMKSMGDTIQRYITKHHLKLSIDRLLPNSIEGSRLLVGSLCEKAGIFHSPIVQNCNKNMLYVQGGLKNCIYTW